MRSPRLMQVFLRAGLRAVGPVRTGGDVAAVRDWLRAGRLDPASLPARLTALHSAAARN
jgi:hypothetical protein